MSAIANTISKNGKWMLIGGLVILASVVGLTSLPLDRVSVWAAPSAESRANESAPAGDLSGLERELKEMVRAGSATDSSSGDSAVDESGLERDLKEVVVPYGLFTQAREASGYAPAIVEEQPVPYRLFTQAREGGVTEVGVSGHYDLFTQAREATGFAPEMSEVNAGQLPLFTWAREASGYGEDGENVGQPPLFTQAREQ